MAPCHLSVPVNRGPMPARTIISVRHRHRCHLNRMEPLVTPVFDKSKLLLWERSVGELWFCYQSGAWGGGGGGHGYCATLLLPIDNYRSWLFFFLCVWAQGGEDAFSDAKAENVLEPDRGQFALPWCPESRPWTGMSLQYCCVFYCQYTQGSFE